MLSIIIPTFNRQSFIENTLASILDAIHGIEAEIIVVNDAKEQTITLPERFNKYATIYNNPGTGAASARNYGTSKASGDILLFVDDDILVSRENIKRTLELHLLFPNACFNLNWKYPDEMLSMMKASQFGRFLIHVKLIDYRGWVPHHKWNEKEIFDVDKLAAFYFIIPRSLFVETGGFNENFKNQSVEDDEFSLRLRQKGVRQFIDPTQFVLHAEHDKIKLDARLKRLKTGAYNMQQGYKMGLMEYHIQFSLVKIFFYSITSRLKHVLTPLLRLIPNSSTFDFLYRRIVHILIGTVIFEGYYKRDNSSS